MLSRLLLACLAGSLAVTLARAADEPADATRLKLRTQRVVVFKDGYALIAKSGGATTNAAGELFFDDVPDAAVLGSFWAAPTQGKLVSMLAGWETTKKDVAKDVPCSQPIEILQANVGKQARVELADKAQYSGTIRQVLAESTAAEPTPSLRELFGLPSAETRIVPLRSAVPPVLRTESLTGVNGSQFILRTDDGDVLLNVSQLRTLTIKDMKTTVARTLTTTEKTKRLTFRFAEPNKRCELTLLYFRPGLRWIPTYRVNLDGDEKKKQATIALQAEFLNEAEDLDDVPIDIVVGVPNFRYRDTPSPLVLEQTMRNALASAAPQLMNQLALSNQVMGNTRFNNGDFAPQAAAAIELPGELATGGMQDLFVYNLPKIKLGKGQRAALSIFNTEVPYRSVYTWDLRITRSDVEAAPAGTGGVSPLQISENKVWHQLVLANNTPFPWTTGAVMITQGTQPLAQEMLTYTPPRSEVRVPVTVSVDTRGTYEEKEIGRRLRELTWENVAYAKIDKTATLTLHNFKSVPVETEITMRLGGKAVEATHDGQITLGTFEASDWRDYRGSPAVNNSSTIRWRVTVKPGESFRPSVTYGFFTRH